MTNRHLFDILQSNSAAGLPPPVAGDFTPNRHASQASVAGAISKTGGASVLASRREPWVCAARGDARPTKFFWFASSTDFAAFESFARHPKTLHHRLPVVLFSRAN